MLLQYHGPVVYLQFDSCYCRCFLLIPIIFLFLLLFHWFAPTEQAVIISKRLDLKEKIFNESREK